MQCDRCLETNLQRSRKRGLEALVRFLILPWRCSLCDRRMLKFAWLKSPPTNQKQPMTSSEQH